MQYSYVTGYFIKRRHSCYFHSAAIWSGRITFLCALVSWTVGKSHPTCATTLYQWLTISSQWLVRYSLDRCSVIINELVILRFWIKTLPVLLSFLGIVFLIPWFSFDKKKQEKMFKLSSASFFFMGECLISEASCSNDVRYSRGSRHFQETLLESSPTTRFS